MEGSIFEEDFKKLAHDYIEAMTKFRLQKEILANMYRTQYEELQKLMEEKDGNNK